MNAAEWKAKKESFVGAPYRPFEKAVCPVTGRLEELDPICGFSLGGMKSKHLRKELEPPIGWGLNPSVGFETRFHSQVVSNITFRVLHRGFTKGNMLVCFSEDELWMKNLDQLSGEIDFAGRKEPCRNLWRDFLLKVIGPISPFYLPPDREDDEWFSFTGNVLVNGLKCSFRPPTAAGCVIDVPNVCGGPPELPCEIPVSFRDFDYLYTQQLLRAPSSPPLNEAFPWLVEKFFGSHGKPAPFSRLLNEGAMLSHAEMTRYIEAGHGLLGMIKGERERFRLTFKVPQLEMRSVGS